MPRPNVETARREQILTAACEVISALGLHELRLADVAQRAGVSAGMVHYYFDGKRAVLAEAFAFNARRSLERRRRLLESDDPPLEVLRRVVESYLPDDDRTLSAWRVWAELWAQAMRDADFQQINEALYQEWRAMIVVIVERAQGDGSARGGDPTAVANMLIAMIDGLATQVLVNSAEMTVARMRETLGAFIDGWVASPPTPTGTPAR